MESNFLDNGQMVYDFGLTKQYIKDLIDSFDHAISLWNGDDQEYVKTMKEQSERWLELPVSPSAEQMSRVIFLFVEKVLAQTNMINGEKEVKVNSVIVHETDTGYAQSFEQDAHSELMGTINLKHIVFSDQIKSEWGDSQLYEKLLNGELFTNPKSL
jgi:6-pyruvoyltetrahydropterin/6-carboxytetrahydropterin synthase